MSSRANIPFLIAGAIASLTLLTSGVFAVAPYVAFLSSVAALNVALPVIFISFALSMVVIAFSYKMIKQNKKSQENSKAEVEELNKESRKEENMRAPIIEYKGAKENEEELSDKERETDEISELKNEVKVMKRMLSNLEAKFDQSTKRIDSPTTEDEANSQMKFCPKDKERGWNTTFSDIILPIDIKEKLKEICKSKSGGYLLYGPPGTGKTSISKAIANQTKSLFAFIFVSASYLSNQSNIDQVFEKAETNSPCIIFIDEIDGIGKRRTGNEDAGPLTHLLTKLDKEFLSSKNITVVAATNYKEHLDPALIRGGRLDVHINISVLDVTTRRKVLGERLKELSPKDIGTIVENTDGFSPANLIALIDHIKESKQKVIEGKQRKVPFSTLCKNFKKEHNIKDEPDKKYRNSKTKNERSSGSSSSSRSLSSRSSSVSSLLSDVFSQGSAQQIRP